jgi:hypothetical protein
MNPLAVWGKPPASGLRATWLGHSTVLIEVDRLGGSRRWAAWSSLAADDSFGDAFEGCHQIHRQREYHGGVLLDADLDQGLQVA